jgi:hypothetical protein
MVVDIQHRPALVWERQLPLPLAPAPGSGAASPAPLTIGPAHVWASLPPQAKAQVMEAVTLVIREVLHAASRD